MNEGELLLKLERNGRLCSIGVVVKAELIEAWDLNPFEENIKVTVVDNLLIFQRRKGEGVFSNDRIDTSKKG
jgi:hypothetical protein